VFSYSILSKQLLKFCRHHIRQPCQTEAIKPGSTIDEGVSL